MYKRIVIKVGTNLIADEKGVRRDFLKNFTTQAAGLMKAGKDVVIVSSGAIGLGIKKLGLSAKPSDVAEKQAVAAVGQISLMQEYESMFEKQGMHAAQVLLDHEDIRHRAKIANASNTLNKLLEWRIVPVINENDAVATEEIKFGDNDALAAITGSLVNADLVIILTSVDGVYDKNPQKYPGASLIRNIENIDDYIDKIDTTGKTGFGTGGMATKLEAARKLNYAGIPLIIANGNAPGVVETAASGAGAGTFIYKKGKRAESKKRWILLNLRTKGEVTIDEGAKKALLSGKSLLCVGVSGVKGDFDFGDAVEISDAKGVKLAKGISNYSSKDLKSVKGKKSKEIKALMQSGFYEEAIHRDNMASYTKG